MEIFKEIEPLRAFLSARGAHPSTVGFVPTMGALHEGHLSLIRRSKQDNEVTVCSIFVNPTQFNNPADLQRYPRTWEADCKLLESEKCDVLFAPEVEAMYPHPSTLKFSFGLLDQSFEGAYRPGHFSGVALVVAKLFNIVQPTRAYFGQKDYQQFLIVSKLVEELKFNVRLTCFPIVREKEGLAMSSRNQRLSADGRKSALLLIRALRDAQTLLLAQTPWHEVKTKIEELFSTSGEVRLEYFALADRENLFPIENVTSQNLSQAILLVAAYVEDVRLIDNLFVADNS